MAASGISFLFMFLVGLSMPLFIGMTAATGEAASSVTGSQPMMSWGVIAFHVVIVSLLSNLGKLFPMFFYRDRKLSERLALSIGMFTRGEVGAGVIFIALGYSLGGPALVISVLTLVLNLVLTGIFVVWVKNSPCGLTLPKSSMPYRRSVERRISPESVSDLSLRI